MITIVTVGLLLSWLEQSQLPDAFPGDSDNQDAQGKRRGILIVGLKPPSVISRTVAAAGGCRDFVGICPSLVRTTAKEDAKTGRGKAGAR